MFALIPRGGSIVTFRDLCNKEIGNFSWDAADKNMRNLSLIYDFEFKMASIIDSSSGSKARDKWQLARKIHFPASAPAERLSFALLFCPFPREIKSISRPCFSANLDS